VFPSLFSVSIWLLKNTPLRRFSRPSEWRHTSKYAARPGISRALPLGIFKQPSNNGLFRTLLDPYWQAGPLFIFTEGMKKGRPGCAGLHPFREIAASLFLGGRP
jgi:hypothetical protein